MVIPTDAEIRALHERHAPTPHAFDRVYTHCRIVAAIADQLLARTRLDDVDAALVRAGCLLHDIGVYRLYDAHGRLDHARYVRHGVLGHELLAREGLPEALCRFCSCHIGMGLTRDDVRAQGLEIPVADYVPTTVEEELVAYADSFHTKSSPPTLRTARAYAASVGRFGADKEARFWALRDRFGEPDLVPLATTHRHAVVDARDGAA